MGLAFREVSGQAPTSSRYPCNPLLNIQISIEELRDVEVRQATRKLKNGRAAGTDRISAEMIKTSMNTFMDVRLTLFAII